MSELVLATADICLHGTSSTLCEWCNYKSRIPHLESQLRDAVELLKIYHQALDKMAAGYSGMFGSPSTDTKEEAWEMCSTIIAKALSSPVPESLKGLLNDKSE